MKKTLAVFLAVVMMFTMLCMQASALNLVEENGITYAENVTRAESGFDLQGSSKCAYFCANGIPITIENRNDSVLGSVVKWNYQGTDYEKIVPAAIIICGGSWDQPVESTSVTMNGGTVYYGVFGGGVKETATVGSEENPGKIDVNINGGDFLDGIVGGGIRGDVYGEIDVYVGGLSTVAENVIGGGFWGDVHGSTNVQLDGGSFGIRRDSTFICAAGVFGDVYGSSDITIDGAFVNGSVAGGSMISGNVYGDTSATLDSGTVTDLGGGGIGYFSSNYGGSTVQGNTTVTVNGGTVKDSVAGGAVSTSAPCHVDGNTKVIINDGEIGRTLANHITNVYGGGILGDVSGTTEVIVNGGNLNNEVIGGSCEGSVGGQTSIVVNDGTIADGIVGGSETGSVGSTVIKVEGGEITSGGIMGGSEIGDVASSVLIEINGGTICGDLVGGASQGNIGGNVEIGVKGGAVDGNVVVGSLVSGDIATNEDAEIVVAVAEESHTGEVVVPEENPAVVNFDPEDDVVNLKEHNFSAWETVIPATCLESGTETRHCIDPFCEEVETRVVNATGHNFTEWEVTKEITLSHNGEEQRYCTACGETETRIIPCDGDDVNIIGGTCTCHTEQGFMGMFFKVYFAICRLLNINKICEFCGGTHY